MPCILITGGAGFIGKNLILHLRNTIGYTGEIIVIDNFKTSSKEDYYKVTNKLDVLLYNFDITENRVWDIIKDSDVVVNQLYHLASIASPVLYKKSPLETLDVGYIGTRNVMSFALINNTRVLFASSSEVYGEAQVSPQYEDYYGNTNTFGERSSYDCSKRVAEALMYTYKTKCNSDIRIARIFNTYGPLMNINDGRLVTEIIKSILVGNTMTVYGDGNQKRSMCFVDDTVCMLYNLMQSDYYKPMNVGNDNEMSVNEIITVAKIVSGQDINVVYRELTQNDPLYRRPCLVNNKNIIGSREYICISDGLDKTIKYFSNSLDNIEF